MYFNNGSDDSLYAEARFWAGIASDDTDTFPIADFTRGANFGLDKAVGIIKKADGKWQWDDHNNTDLPIATTALFAGRRDYGLSPVHMKLHRVRVKDSAGEWHIIEPVDRRSLTDTELNETAGMPRKYDILGNSLMFYPTSLHGAAAAVELEYQRGASYFVVGDTTKQPGFDSQFHRLIALYAALDYCEANSLDVRAAAIRARIGRAPDPLMNEPGSGLERDLSSHYSGRDVDQRIRLSPRREDYGESALM